MPQMIFIGDLQKNHLLHLVGVLFQHVYFFNLSFTNSLES